MRFRRNDVPDYWKFPERLEQELIKRKMSKAALSEQIGLSRPTISSWIINGTPPGLDSVAKIADIFGVSIDYLCGRVATKEEMQNSENELKIKQKEELFSLIRQMKPDDWIFIVKQLELRLSEVKERNEQ